uniref:tRNA pseudouridine synthase A 2 n=2 Tax=Protochlamydia amoebophila (strain UWE25) TaxID=264201 RepID=TRUA2_PARUW|nr:RecName: Full=tRNA pseudouridine synthase A 2; AltName: Full=tRNA pseudouridine(38-40) synthase; AltName: Full=tRNA pseudouridylate synthase I 2; AltName: Full=tRNA-uridine isomerase I 2 [Candidatus Protochlamydia amoebophila UWE25]
MDYTTQSDLSLSKSMQNIKLKIAYDGQAYFGWQKTPAGPSVEKTLQNSLEQILQHTISLQAASRTDKGVHARGQIVNFLTTKSITDLQKFILSLNSLLPTDLRILSAEKMPSTFHPTLNCVAKEYCYYICYDFVQLPEYRPYSWHCPFPLMLGKMTQAISVLIGEHDFSAFCNFKKNVNYTDYIRRVQAIHLEVLNHKRLCIRIKGNHFLYKMVRNIVGTLIYIGKGKLMVEDIPSILQSQDRKMAGVTAPAHGLFLQTVLY